jgi:hypothetical protein
VDSFSRTISGHAAKGDGSFYATPGPPDGVFLREKGRHLISADVLCVSIERLMLHKREFRNDYAYQLPARLAGAVGRLKLEKRHASKMSERVLFQKLSLCLKFIRYSMRTKQTTATVQKVRIFNRRGLSSDPVFCNQVGGPNISMPLGRLDGRVSSMAAALAAMPNVTANVSVLNASFAAVGLTLNDMVILSGTCIGVAKVDATSSAYPGSIVRELCLISRNRTAQELEQSRVTSLSKLAA